MTAGAGGQVIVDKKDRLILASGWIQAACLTLRLLAAGLPYGASRRLRRLLTPYAVRSPAHFAPVPKWQ